MEDLSCRCEGLPGMIACFILFTIFMKKNENVNLAPKTKSDGFKVF